MRDFLQISPKRIFQADAGLVSINENRTFNDQGFHYAQRPRNAVIFEGATVASFSQFANEMFGNALSLHLNFWIKLRRPRFARHCLPNTPHDNFPDARVGAFPVAMVGRFEGRVQITNSYA